MRSRLRRRILPAGVLFILIAASDFATAVFAQIIENPAKPKASNAGRVVVAEQVLAISDEGTSDYYFKWPHGLRTGPDGSLSLLDRDQALRFDENGKFLGNLLKKGQGPGEVNSPGACLATTRNVIIISNYPDKIVFLDPAGKFEKEIPIRQEGRTILSILLYHGGSFLFSGWDFPRTTGDPKTVEVPQKFFAVSEATGEVKNLTTFTTKAFVITAAGGGGGMFPVMDLITTPFQEKFLALAHTEEYLVKIYDPAANTVVREFRRAYERVKGEPLTAAEKKGGVLAGGQHYTRPERKFENDVKNILARDNEIWAVTSTKDKTKGVLVDVFDGEGVYQDCFWLKLPEPALENVLSPGSCALDDDSLWIVEHSEDDTYTIKKYRIVAEGTAEPESKGGGE